MHAKREINCIILIQAFIVSHALRIVMLDVPSPTADGESVELTCSYDLENDRLYSVKWYKNGFEFYRFVPKEWPPAQFLKMAGIKGDVSRSDANRVYLRYVDLNSAGKYRCEISAEAPSFNTAAAEKDMQIYVLPSEGPRVTSSSSSYKPGDILMANCTSAKSKPPATLNWYINGEQTNIEHEVDYATTLHADGLETSSLSLKLRVIEKYFINKVMTIKCTSSIPDVSQLSNEAELKFYYGDKDEENLLRMKEKLSQVNSGLISITNPTIKEYQILMILYILLTFVHHWFTLT